MKILYVFVYATLLTFSMSSASEKPPVTLTVYEELLNGADPFAEEEVKENYKLKKIGEINVKNPYIALFFQGVFKSAIKEKGLVHPLVGRPIYVEMKTKGQKFGKLIQINLGYKNGFYLIERNQKSGEFESYHPSYNGPYSELMQRYLQSKIKSLTE